MNVLILGGGYAGVTAALRLARRAPRHVHVTLINDGPDLVERIRLHQLAAGQPLRRHPLAGFLAGTRVRLLDGRVTDVDLTAHTARTATDTLPWDVLVLALGSRTDTSFPGVEEHAFTLDAGSTEALAARLPSAHQLSVVGGGLTAIEAVTEIAEHAPSLQVRLVTRGVLLPGFSDEARAHTRRVLARLHVTVLEHTGVQRVTATHLETSAGPLAHDVCVWSAGFRATPLPRGLDLDTNGSGQVRVDESLRAWGRDDVWVAGDLAWCPTLPFTQGCKSAGPSAAWAVDNLLGPRARPFRYSSPYFCVSLGRRDGLVQKALPDGRLLGSVTTGRTAALIKELICRFTLWQLGFERRGWASYRLFEARPSALEARSVSS